MGQKTDGRKLIDGGHGDNETENLAHCVPVDDGFSGCALCGEPFDQFWEDASSEWMYRNAIPVTIVEGECVPVSSDTAVEAGESTRHLVHWLCFEACDRREAARMLQKPGDTSTTTASHGENGDDAKGALSMENKPEAVGV